LKDPHNAASGDLYVPGAGSRAGMAGRLRHYVDAIASLSIALGHVQDLDREAFIELRVETAPR